MSALPAPLSIFPREKLLQVARALPADLQVLSSLGELLQNPNSDLDQVADLLRRDVAMAARIVRISNSPLFGGSGGIASVEEAVNRVGFGEILKLVGTATAARFTESALDHYGIGAHRLRANMLYGALAAEALARQAGKDPRIAYTAGLLRPLGIMVLDRASRGHTAPGDAYAAATWPSYSAWEGQMFGVDNCEVAALILGEWRFPAELTEGIRAHYLARPADFEQPLAALLNLANGLSHRVSRSFAGEACWWEITPAKLQAAGLREEDFGPAVVETERAFAHAIALLGGS
ncbi:MAG: hypothetical protein B9S34_10310 [Opitutia bacterium Tous-C1TDCM]|nr:MAG: hypothetical protein B9S34_10310 [Opitutae bacterium Tous-C1TDCM]